MKNKKIPVARLLTVKIVIWYAKKNGDTRLPNKEKATDNIWYIAKPFPKKINPVWR
jgi:hypothetical protein